MYKNNNGNYSLGLVPIDRFQPRLLTISDYCYSDRLPLQILDLHQQPLAFGFYLLQQNLQAVLSSRLATGLPGRNVFQAPMHISLRIWHQFQITWGRSPSFLKPCDSIAERTFPVFVDLLNIVDAKPV